MKLRVALFLLLPLVVPATVNASFRLHAQQGYDLCDLFSVGPDPESVLNVLDPGPLQDLAATVDQPVHGAGPVRTLLDARLGGRVSVRI